MKLSAGLKMILAAVAAALAIGVGSILAGYFQYNALAQRIAETRLAAAGEIAQTEIKNQLARNRQVTSDIAGDPAVVSYITAALGARGVGGEVVDTASIRDLIGTRARKAGFDFAAVFDTSGRFLTASGDDIGDNALSGLSVVKGTLKSFAARSAIVLLHDRAYLVNAAPMLSGQQMQALLLTGTHFGNDDLGALAKRAGSDLAIAFTRPGAERIPAASLTPDKVADLLHRVGDWSAPKSSTSESASGHLSTLDLNGQSERLGLMPLQSDPGIPVTLIVLEPQTRDAALTRGIALPLVAFAAGAIVLVWLGLLTLWLRATRPLARLYVLAERSLLGDHALDFRVKATPTIACIGECLNDLALRLDRYRVPPGTPRRRATDAVQPGLRAANDR